MDLKIVVATSNGVASQVARILQHSLFSKVQYCGFCEAGDWVDAVFFHPAEAAVTGGSTAFG